VTHYTKKAVYKDVCKTVYEKVPFCEEKTVMKPCWKTVQVTEMRTKKVDKGCWTYEEVPAHFKAFCQRLGGGFGGHGHKNSCDPCAPCVPACKPTPTRCVKKWCSNWVTECYPVTCCKKVCEMVPTVCKVTSYKCVPKQVTCKVCEWVCEPCTKTETYTCYETKQVPFTCTRNVVQCVPVEEWVTCTKLVAKTVYREVPISNACCNNGPYTCCSSGGHKLFSNFRGLFHRNNCGSSCGSSCGGCGGCGSGHGGGHGHGH
jgi:hypothetical protein